MPNTNRLDVGTKLGCKCDQPIIVTLEVGNASGMAGGIQPSNTVEGEDGKQRVDQLMFQGAEPLPHWAALKPPPRQGEIPRLAVKQHPVVFRVLVA